ncbi:hypothetical protein XENOCAPTIV_011625 [Xenoophorus captivus]|uniref:Uncharacterized protein n=1 Tax=Xenoophorus captivus TaxID=1517983 RepID=A0ABV0R9I6_9TELE
MQLCPLALMVYSPETSLNFSSWYSSLLLCVTVNSFLRPPSDVTGHGVQVIEPSGHSIRQTFQATLHHGVLMQSNQTHSNDKAVSWSSTVSLFFNNGHPICYGS